MKDFDNNQQINKAEELFIEGEKLLKIGKYKEALLKFQEASQIYFEWKSWAAYTLSKTQMVIGHIYLSKFDEALEQAQNLWKEIEVLPISNKDKHWMEAYSGLGLAHFYKGNFLKALEAQKMAVEKGELSIPNKKKRLSGLYNNLGNTYIYLSQHNNALHYLQKALKLRLELPDMPPVNIANTYNNIGNCYGYKGDYQKALQNYEASLNIRLQHLPENHLHVAESYHNISWCHTQSYDDDLALLYQQKALAIRLKVLGTHHSEVAHSYDSLGVSLARKKQIQKAMDYHQKAMQIWKEDHHLRGNAYVNIAWCFSFEQKYAQAIEAMNKALKIYTKIYGNDHWYALKCYAHLCRYYTQKEDYERAVAIGKKGVNLILQTKEEKSYPVWMVVYTNLGVAYLAKKKLQKALPQFQQALIIAAEDFEEKSPYQSPSIEGQILDTSYLIAAMTHKAATFYELYAETQNIKDLKASVESYCLACELTNRRRSNYQMEGSKLEAGKEAFRLFESALEASLQLYKVGQKEVNFQGVFALIEDSKAFVLLSKLKETQAKITANIPQKLLEKERQLEIEKNYLQKSIQKEKNNNKPSQQNEAYLSELQSQLFDVHQKTQQLVQRLEKNYPQYHQLKYQQKNISASKIQASLEEETVLIEYFVGEKILIIVVIGKSFCRLESVDLSLVLEDYSLSEMVEDFQLAINDSINQELYIEVAYELYELLIAPIEADLDGKKELLIVPDGVLSQIPFEALLTAMPESMDIAYIALPYLLLQYNICYQYSATLWQHIQERKARQSIVAKGFVGFAPVVYDGEMEVTSRSANPYFEKEKEELILRGERYAALPHSEFEVQNIANLLQKNRMVTQLFLREQATVEDFMEAVDGKILQFVHIAAHGVYDVEHPEQSGIVFSPERETADGGRLTEGGKRQMEGKINVLSENGSMLYISDTYTLDLSGIDLVVLSCCETGLGKWAKGEGTIAMNRGFLYAGANHVVYTLFKVYDKASSQLTQSLYENILEGKTYSQALRVAKLQLIQSRLAPKAWAGYVLLG